MLNDVVGLRFRRFRLNSQNMYIKSSFFSFHSAAVVTQSILLLHLALSLRVRVYNAPRETICIKKGQYTTHTHMNLYSFFPGEFPIAGACKEKRDQQFRGEGKEEPAREKKKTKKKKTRFFILFGR
jgi:hypothetical protein